jgi:sporulation protein YlmC with PRC-barrel domain
VAGSSSLRHDDRLGETRDRSRLALRPSAYGDRPRSKRDVLLVGTTALRGNGVYDVAGRFLGQIEELVLDIHTGRVAYALMLVVDFLGMGRKLYAIPWSTVSVDGVYPRCVINVALERLIDAPSPDGDLLPRMADPGWATEVHAYFGCKPYWK